jgi:hypothetical protein
MDRRRQKWSTKHYTENFRIGNINPHKIGGGWVDIVCSDRKISSIILLIRKMKYGMKSDHWGKTDWVV